MAARRVAERFRLPRDAGWPKPADAESSVVLTDVTSVHPEGSPAVAPVKGPMSRVVDGNKIQQLRYDFQRQHRDRQGRYPLEEQEDVIERQIREYERTGATLSPGGASVSSLL